MSYHLKRDCVVHILTSAYSQPTSAFQALDVVSPSRLFAVARLRIQGAADSVRPSRSEFAPTALNVVYAISQAKAGISALHSIIVPGVSYSLRQRADVAVEHAQRGISLLRRFHELVLPFGDRPVRLVDLGENAAILDDAVSALDASALAARI